MNFSDIQNTLQNIMGRKVTQEEIGNALGIKKSAVNIRIKNGSVLKPHEIRKIEEYFGIEYKELHVLSREEVKKLEEESCIELPVLGDVEASMGYGVSIYNENQTASYNLSMQLARDLSLSKNSSHIIFARGNSMQPTIADGDSLLIDSSKKDIYDGKIYCIRMNGQLYAKRLQKLSPAKIKVISDNKDYEPIVIDFEEKNDCDFEIIGEVRWSGRVFR